MAEVMTIIVCPFCDTWSVARMDSDEASRMFSEHMRDDHK